MKIITVLAALTGMSNACSLVFFPILSVEERALQSLILAGLCTGAIATTFGHRVMFAGALLPTMLGLVLLWITDGTVSHIELDRLLYGGGITIFSVVIWMVARDNYTHFKQTISMRFATEKLNQDLEVALGDAKVADRAKTRFLASASHDLRQPIHALSLFSAALTMQPLPEQAKQLSLNINESVKVLASQLDALLDLSKLDAGIVTPNIELTNISEMLTRICRDYLAEINAKNLHLRTSVEPQIYLETDPLLFERIVRNLMSNAVKYTEQGSIFVILKRGLMISNKMELIIEDTGIGIAESEQAKVLDEFYQVSLEKTAAKIGLGLGLAIVRRLLALLDISIQMRSEAGKGTQISLLLMASAQANSDVRSDLSASLEDLKLIIIDDDTAVIAGMKALLENHGCCCEIAANISDAINLTAKLKPDLIISDLHIGEESGVDAISQIRQTYPQVKALIITGDTSAESLRETQALNLVVLHKPLNSDHLIQQINRLVTR